jgi:crotonobetaine/carnitine-CoA ligase
VDKSAMDVIGDQNLRQMWDDLAEVYGDKTALIFESCEGEAQQFSYTFLNEEINRTANLFNGLGIQKGDKVALHLDNCPEFFFAGSDWQKSVPSWCRLTPGYCMMKVCGSCKTAGRVLVTTENFYPLYRRIHQEGKTQLNHICLIDRNFCVSDTAVSDFYQLKRAQPALTIRQC